MEKANPKRLGRYIRARRRWLNMSQDDVAEAGGPSDKRQTQLEKGVGPHPSLTTLRKVDKALQWEEGSASRVLYGGGEPVEEPVKPVDRTKVTQLEEALARHGISRIAARRQTVGGGFQFDPTAIDQLTDLLNSVPAPATVTEAASEPNESATPESVAPEKQATHDAVAGDPVVKPARARRRGTTSAN